MRMQHEAFELVLFERVDQSLMLVAGEPATDDVPVFFAIMPAANDSPAEEVQPPPA
jgi:hypothetical protein